MKRNILKFAAYAVLVVFTPLQMAWAGDEVPAVAQLPEDLLPLRNPEEPEELIGDRLSIPSSQPLSCPPLGFCPTSLEFLSGNQPLSPAGQEAREQEIFGETKPGITSGNLKDLAKDIRPVVEPEVKIEFRNPFDQVPLSVPPVNPALLEPPSLYLEGEKVKIDVPSLEPPPLEKPVPLIEERNFSGNAAVIFGSPQKEKKTEKTAKKGKIGKRNWRGGKWIRGGDGKE